MSKTESISEFELLVEKLSKAVSFQYPGKCAPSVIISWLPSKEWYVSILRYEDSHEDKKVMHKARNKSLEVALKDISEQLLKSVVKEKDPLDELNIFLSKK